MAYEIFFRTLNNSGLHRYLLAAAVNTIEAALDRGRAYYQVDGPKWQTSPPFK